MVVAATCLLGGCSGADSASGDAAGDMPADVSATQTPPDLAAGGANRCQHTDVAGGLELWHSLPGPTTTAVFDRLAGELRDELGIDLEFRVFKGDTDLIEHLTEASDDERPDIILVTEQSTRALLDSGRFLSPGECDPTITADVLPVVAATYSIDGLLPALPFGVSVPVLIFDTERFRRAGLDPAVPPTTLDDLLAASAQIRDSGLSEHGLAVTDACGNMVVEQFGAAAGQVWGTPDNGHGRSSVTVDLGWPTAVAYFEALRDGVFDGHVDYMGPNASGMDDLVAITVPETGVVMTVHTSAALGELVTMLDNGNFSDLGLGVAALPQATSGSLIGGNALWMFDSGDDVRIARTWSAMEWLYEPRQLATFAVAAGYVPPTAAAAAEPAVAELWRRYPQLRVPYEVVASTPVGVASSGLIMGPYEGKASVLRDLCDRIIDHGADPQEALSRATDSLNYLAEQYEAMLSGSAPPVTEPPSPTSPTAIHGEVRCESGAEVVGIWIDAPSGGSGWVEFTSTDQGSAFFATTLDRPGKYQLHVGCGGTPGSWASSYFSRYVVEDGLHFVCRDSGGSARGWCDLESE